MIAWFFKSSKLCFKPPFALFHSPELQGGHGMTRILLRFPVKTIDSNQYQMMHVYQWKLAFFVSALPLEVPSKSSKKQINDDNIWQTSSAAYGNFWLERWVQRIRFKKRWSWVKKKGESFDTYRLMNVTYRYRMLPARRTFLEMWILMTHVHPSTTSKATKYF